jgi:sulfate adenylyltransferase subunit 1 (EFTu-like GTPase family)
VGGAGTTPGAGGAVLVQTSPSNVAASTVVTVSNQGTSTFQPNTNTAGAVVAKGITSQSGDLFAAQDSSANVLSRFDKNGYWMTRKSSAPADADLATGELALWFDSTAGAAKLMVKAKDAGGTVRTATIALA